MDRKIGRYLDRHAPPRDTYIHIIHACIRNIHSHAMCTIHTVHTMRAIPTNMHAYIHTHAYVRYLVVLRRCFAESAASRWRLREHFASVHVKLQFPEI